MKNTFKNRMDLFYIFNSDKIALILIFLVVLVFGGVFSYKITHGASIYDFNEKKYTGESRLEKASYKKTYDLPSLDSATPVSTGIKVNFSYIVEDSTYVNEIFLNKDGFSMISDKIDQDIQAVIVRFNERNPQDAILTLRRD